MKNLVTSLICLSAMFLINCSNCNAQWQQTNGAFNGHVQSIAVNGSHIVAGTYDGDIFNSQDGGDTWTATDTGLSTIFSLAINGKYIFAGTYQEGLFFSIDSGSHWTLVDSGIANTTNIFSLAISGSNIFAASYGAVFLSQNNGTSWIAVDSGLPNDFIHALDASGTNIFAGTGSGVFLSKDTGNSWLRVDTGFTNTNITSLAIRGNNIFAGTVSGGIFLSPDNGNSWIPIDSGLPSGFVGSLTVSGSTIFAAVDSGVFISKNNGANWTAFNSGFPDSVHAYNIIRLDVNETYIFAATANRGVWKRPLLDVAVEEISAVKDFSIYPNPSNGIINIQLKETVNGKISFQVYDVLGREVMGEVVFANNNTAAKQINISNLQPGIYFLQMKTKNQSITKKFIKG